MYLNVAGPGRGLAGRSHLGQDKPSVHIHVDPEPFKPVMTALPYMGVSAAMLMGTALLPKDEPWAKTTRLVMAGAGTVSAIVGVIAALRTAKAISAPSGPIAASAPPQGQEVPKVSPGKLSEMLAIGFDPLQPKTGGTTRQMFANQYYEASIKNDSDKTLTFYPGVAIFDSDGKLVYATPTIQRQSVTLAPGESKAMGTPELADQAKKPENEPIFLVPSGVIYWTPQTYAVEIQLFRKRADSEYFMTTESIPIKYYFLA